MPAAYNNSKGIHMIAKVDDRRMTVIDFKLGIVMVMQVDLFLKDYYCHYWGGRIQ